MAKKKDVKRWNQQGERNQFVPVEPVEMMDMSNTVNPKAPLKLVQVVEYANMGYMFAGYDRLLAEADLSFTDIGPGQAILFLNKKRDYLKLLVGNGTDNPVILAYKLAPGMRIPAHGIKEIVRSLLKRGEVQMDDRLRGAVGRNYQETQESHAT